MKKSTAACVVLFTLGAIGAAGAAELPLKARPKPPPAPTWWVSGGALLWTVKSASLPPTLTTFVPGSPSAVTGFGGALGIPGTVLQSPDHLNYGPFGGGRFTIGHWLESDPRLAGTIRFNGREIEVFINDRLLAPNSKVMRDAAEEEFQPFFSRLFANGEYVLSYREDPRRLFSVRVKTSQVFAVSTLLNNSYSLTPAAQ